MSTFAKVFQTADGQAVRLPKAFQFDTDEVCIKRIGTAVLLYPKQHAWDLMAATIGQADEDFLPVRNQAVKSGKRKKH